MRKTNINGIGIVAAMVHGGIKNCVDKFWVNRAKVFFPFFFCGFLSTSGTQLEQYSIVYDPWCQTKI